LFLACYCSVYFVASERPLLAKSGHSNLKKTVVCPLLHSI